MVRLVIIVHTSRAMNSDSFCKPFVGNNDNDTTIFTEDFLRKTPNALLKKYFDSKEVLQQIAWDELKETDTEPIIETLQELSNDKRTSIEQEFRDMNEQACEAGVRVLLEEAESDFHNLQLSDTFEQMSRHVQLRPLAGF